MYYSSLGFNAIWGFRLYRCENNNEIRFRPEFVHLFGGASAYNLTYTVELFKSSWLHETILVVSDWYCGFISMRTIEEKGKEFVSVVYIIFEIL